MKPVRWLALPLLLVPLILLGCQGGSDGSKEKIYDVKGKVVALDADKKTVVLDHEDIPGFMRAMEMKFPLEKATLAENIKVGDHVQGKLKVKAGETVITELQKR
jgi:protein SCO1/2